MAGQSVPYVGSHCAPCRQGQGCKVVELGTQTLLAAVTQPLSPPVLFGSKNGMKKCSGGNSAVGSA